MRNFAPFLSSFLTIPAKSPALRNFVLFSAQISLIQRRKHPSRSVLRLPDPLGAFMPTGTPYQPWGASGTPV